MAAIREIDGLRPTVSNTLTRDNVEEFYESVYQAMRDFVLIKPTYDYLNNRLEYHYAVMEFDYDNIIAQTDEFVTWA